MMNKKMNKILATTLTVGMIMNNGKKVDACDSAVILEAATEASVACPVAGPAIMGGAILVVTGITIYGKCISNKANELDIYFTLGHLPDYWRPNSIMDKINPGGRVIQRRVYGPDGKPKLDVDMSHHGTPAYHPWKVDGKYYHAHDHIYNKGYKKTRRPGRELSSQEYQKYIKDIDKINVNRRYRMRVEPKDEQNFVKQSK